MAEIVQYYGNTAPWEKGGVVVMEDDEGVDRQFTIKFVNRIVDGMTGIWIGSKSDTWFKRDGDYVQMIAPEKTIEEKYRILVAGLKNHMNAFPAKQLLESVGESW